ncbi:unnamed protein product [Mytilus edulis]|uniref:Uncharacterized protein n=1 Tax=Mytilus edulis TaxID=6550 RepID=A0A8S3TEE2_MYTED|nr:unnamed protein product [Mytilus edulis]
MVDSFIVNALDESLEVEEEVETEPSSMHCCTFCSYSSKYKQNVKRHTQNAHAPNNAETKHFTMYLCDQCGMVFKTASGLNIHYKGKHTQEFRFKCKVCDRGFNTLWNYRGHITTHEPVLRHRCDVCDKTFAYKETLKQHITSVHTNETSTNMRSFIQFTEIFKGTFPCSTWWKRTQVCNYCHTNEDSQISCFCDVCKIFICDNCVIEHRMKNRNHSYIYQPEILRGYKLANSWERRLHYYEIIDLKFVTADIVVILELKKLCTYNLIGGLINSFTITPDQEDRSSRIACINDCKIAVTVPSNNIIKIVTIITPPITDLGTPEGTNMTGNHM